MSRKCGSCGKENPDLSIYCCWCGGELASIFSTPAEGVSPAVCETCGAETGLLEVCPRCGSSRRARTPSAFLNGASVRSPSTLIGATITSIGVVALLFGLLAFIIISFAGSEVDEIPASVTVLAGGLVFVLLLAGVAALVGGIHCMKRTPGGWPFIGAVGGVVASFFLGIPVVVVAIVCLILVLLLPENPDRTRSG